jgi:nicotinamidase-related amidase
MLIDPRDSFLLLVDIQDRLAPAVRDPQRTISNAAILAKSAQRLGIPVYVSEQYPKGLGRTVPELAEYASDHATLEKLHFSCAGDRTLLERLSALRRGQVVITGMETHVCVLQTALGLQNAGMRVFVVQDAVSSRTDENKAAGLERMRSAGCSIVTTEMVVFEWLQKAGTAEFKELMQYIK